ncbi:hypothetical protein ES703_94376 [subsurface metagenome]
MVKKKKESHVVFLLDQTGSMETCKKDTIGGFNNFLKEQKEKKGESLKFSLTLFNSAKVEKRYVGVDIHEVKKLDDKNYVPSNLTPLWDAVGNTIQEFPDDRDVFLIILTDGYENYSKEFKADAVKRLITDKEKNFGWKCLYLGADIESFHDAQSMGVNLHFKVDKSNMKRAYSSVSQSVSGYRDTGDVKYEDK